MSIRTKEPSDLAVVMMARRFSTHSSSAMSSPIWVSLTETLALARAAAMQSRASGARRLRIELGAALRLLAQRLRGREPRAIALRQPLELAHDPVRAQVVGMAERTTAKRREPEAEDRTDVTVARAAHDSLRHRPGGLVQHHQDQPLDDLRGAWAPVGLRADQLVHRGVHARLLPAPVLVEPPTGLAPQPAALHHAGERRGWREPLAKRGVHHARHLLRHA